MSATSPRPSPGARASSSLGVTMAIGAYTGTAEIDRDILAWLDVKGQASDNEDVGGQLEAEEEIDRLLELRLILPLQP